MNDDWRNNPKLAGMDRSKLDMLQNLASQGNSKGANEMLPFKELSKQIGSSRLSFATAEDLERLLGVQPGSASVLGLPVSP